MRKKTLTTLFILFWISWGPINYGAVLADFTHYYPPSRDHYGIAAFFGLTGVSLGPISGLTIVLATNFYEHGFLWK